MCVTNYIAKGVKLIYYIIEKCGDEKQLNVTQVTETHQKMYPFYNKYTLYSA